VIAKFLNVIALALAAAAFCGAMHVDASAASKTTDPAVDRAARDAMAAHATRVPKTVADATSGSFAVVVWELGTGGGECALRHIGGRWRALACGGGQMNAADLERLYHADAHDATAIMTTLAKRG